MDTVAARAARAPAWPGTPDPGDSPSTLARVSDPAPAPTPGPPGRALLRVAGVLTQLAAGACLLIGTIGLVLVEQNGRGGLGPVVGWLVMAMAGLVFGGLIYRGGLVSMLIAAAIDVGSGVVLATFDLEALRRLLAILGAPDVEAIHRVLAIAGFAMIGAGIVCLVGLPHGIRYARWFRDAAASRTAMSTARGFPPPPVPVRTATYIIPAEDLPGTRRRLYAALCGAAIGVGAGIGVLVSSGSDERPASATRAAARGSAAMGSAGAAAPAVAVAVPRTVERPRITEAPVDAGVALDAGAPLDAGAAAIAPVTSVQEMLLVQHRAIARVDRKALAGVIAAGAFGIGTDAGDIAEGRDGVVDQIARDLGAPPSGGFTVESRAMSIGEDRNHAWIAEQLDVSAGGEPRGFAISELAARIDGSWQVVALHWGQPVDDATAQRLAVLSRLPRPARIVDRSDAPAELDQAVRAAFASRLAFAESHSERGDAFNYGSGGERAHGGAAIRRIFSKLRAELRMHDGARVVAGGAWDPAQRAAPWIGWAALNVDFTARSRAETDVTQTFRVLAVLIKEAHGWRIVQTQWSNGGPVH